MIASKCLVDTIQKTRSFIKCSMDASFNKQISYIDIDIHFRI